MCITLYNHNRSDSSQGVCWYCTPFSTGEHKFSSSYMAMLDSKVGLSDPHHQTQPHSANINWTTAHKKTRFISLLPSECEYSLVVNHEAISKLSIHVGKK